MLKTKIDKNNVETILPLTQTQEGMLFHHIMDPNGDDYFEQLSLELTGSIDINQFYNTWNFIINSNEMLRTIFRWEEVNSPVQIILKSYNPNILYYDLCAVENGKIEMDEILSKDKLSKFDLNEVPFRVTLVKREEKSFV